MCFEDGAIELIGVIADRRLETNEWVLSGYHCSPAIFTDLHDLRLQGHEPVKRARVNGKQT